jgi:hypothetical protein
MYVFNFFKLNVYMLLSQIRLNLPNKFSNLH